VTNQDLAATNGLPAPAAAAAGDSDTAAAAAAVDSDTGGIPGSISKDAVVKQVDNEALTVGGFTTKAAISSIKSSNSNRKSSKNDTPTETLMKIYVRDSYFPLEKFVVDEDVVFSTRAPTENDPENHGVLYQDLREYMEKSQTGEIQVDFVMKASYIKLITSTLGQKRNEFTTAIKDALFGKWHYGILDFTLPHLHLIRFNCY
jgi:hypothetical protein